MDACLRSFDTHGITISSLILHLLSEPTLQKHPQVSDLRVHAHILTSALTQPISFDSTMIRDLKWAFEAVKGRYKYEVQQLILDGEEWQFGASQMMAQQIEDFKVKKMAGQMKDVAPELWDLLDTLLSATKKHTSVTAVGVITLQDCLNNLELPHARAKSKHSFCPSMYLGEAFSRT